MPRDTTTSLERAMEDLALGEQSVTIVFTDIAGFTQRIQQVEKWAGPAAAVLVKDEHDKILRQNLGGSGYSYVKSTGDGCLFLYKDACAPLAPLVATQRAFKAYYEARPGREPLQIRIAVHCGRVFIQGTTTAERFDPLGHPVNLTQRIMATAAPGTINLSDEVYRSCLRDGVLPCAVHDMGRHSLKGSKTRFRSGR